MQLATQVVMESPKVPRRPGGGASLPDLNLYYLASQLSHFFYFDKEDKLRYLTLACFNASNQTIHPFQMLLRGTRTPTKLGKSRAHGVPPL